MKRRITAFFICICLSTAGWPMNVSASETEPAVQEALQSEAAAFVEEEPQSEELLSEERLQSEELLSGDQASALENPAFFVSRNFQDGYKGYFICRKGHCSGKRPGAGYNGFARKNKAGGTCNFPEIRGTGASERGTLCF